MKDIDTFQLCVHKFYTTAVLAFTSLPGMYITSFSAILAYFLSLKVLFAILGLLYVLDFITGCAAAMKKYRKDFGVWSFKWFSSEIFAGTIIKGVFYMLFIFFIFIINVLIYKNHIHISLLSSDPFTLVEIAIFVCMIREIWSILFENFEKLGFDFLGHIEKIASKSWKIINKVKGSANE
ncbi:phage holin family protein [Flavobacterium agricola]|uniref:Phage holin family protein n=1 Tax=Flavobacterium agricola TaxID=2870839 RepID=A0ABY6M2Z8_9FLAO|nr:phage holin family protein [Flavobacterium agricola]UYW01810.1 phage holin family protein [Flavobacterium agricola]